MAGPALTPQAAVEQLEQMSSEVRAAILLDARGDLVAQAGADGGRAGRLGELSRELLGLADGAGERAGVDPVARVEISSPRGGVFAMRASGGRRGGLTLVAVAAGGALSSLLFYDMRMTIARLGRPR